MQAGKPDRPKVAKEWQARGFSCDLWVDPPHLTSHTVRNVGGTTARWLYGYKAR